MISGDISVEAWIKLRQHLDGILTVVNFSFGNYNFYLNLSPTGYNCNTNGQNIFHPTLTRNTWVYLACSILYNTTNLLINNLTLVSPNDITSYTIPSKQVIIPSNLTQIYQYTLLSSSSQNLIYLTKDLKLWSYGMDLNQFYINKNK